MRSRSTPPTATCCTSSCRRSPTSAATRTAARSPTACGSRSRCSRPCARRFPEDRPVGVRVSATDWMDRGWDLEQTLAFARELAARGADWIDVSSGGISPAQKIVLAPGCQVPFAEAVKRATGLPTMAVGLITTPAQAEDIVASGKADMVALARAMLYD